MSAPKRPNDFFKFFTVLAGVSNWLGRKVLPVWVIASRARIWFHLIFGGSATTTSAGRMLMQMLGSFAEFERSMVRERTRAGLAAARDRGARLGRPAKLSAHQQQEVIKAVRDGSKTAADAARLFGLHRSNITRLLERSEMKADRNQGRL